MAIYFKMITFLMFGRFLTLFIHVVFISEMDKVHLNYGKGHNFRKAIPVKNRTPAFNIYEKYLSNK